MWEAPDQQTIIKERLDTGTVDVVVMICCSQEFKETGGQSDQAILDISGYALEQIRIPASDCDAVGRLSEHLSVCRRTPRPHRRSLAPLPAAG